MKSFKPGLSVLALLMCSANFNPAHSQLFEMDLIYGGVTDAELIMTEYMRPYANILGSDLNAGWYNTARPHKLGGLDFGVTVSWSKAPASTLSFDPSLLGLNGTLDLSEASMAPTVAGSQDHRPVLSYSETVDLGNGNFEEVEYASYTLPNGTGYDWVPLPMVQFCIGLPFGTDVAFRFIPSVGFREYGEIGLWGVGGKHSISQWIPGVKDLELLDIAVQGGYTRTNSLIHVDVAPQSIVEVDPYPDFPWGSDQEITQMIEGWTVNLIASQTFPIISFYQGIGYASSMVAMIMEGTYPIPMVITDTSSPDFGKVTYEKVENPMEMRYANINNLRYNLGARVKLGVLTLHYDVTYTLYFTQSVGLGISFR